jgi:hypothetical protein
MTPFEPMASWQQQKKGKEKEANKGKNSPAHLPHIGSARKSKEK